MSQVITVYASFEYPNMPVCETVLNYDKARQLVHEYADEYIDVKPELVYGMYKGKQERALCFNVTGLSCMDKIAAVFNEQLNQECVLAVHEDDCFLCYPDSSWEYIGEWTQVSREFAEKQDAYTLYPLTGKYYVAL